MKTAITTYCVNTLTGPALVQMLQIFGFGSYTSTSESVGRNFIIIAQDFLNVIKYELKIKGKFK